MTRMVIIHKTPSVWNKIEWLEENYKGKSRINKNKIHRRFNPSTRDFKKNNLQFRIPYKKQ